MNKRLKQFISVFLILVFMLGSGAGQLIHATFHTDFSKGKSTAGTSVNLPHGYCSALQLMLPEFSDAMIVSVSASINNQPNSFADINILIPLFYSFKTSDRAPPVLA